MRVGDHEKTGVQTSEVSYNPIRKDDTACLWVDFSEYIIGIVFQNLNSQYQHQLFYGGYDPSAIASYYSEKIHDDHHHTTTLYDMGKARTFPYFT